MTGFVWLAECFTIVEFNHSFRKYLLSTYYVLALFWALGIHQRTRQTKTPVLVELTF